MRRYGRQLKEYLENMLGMCQCHGACFLDMGGKVRRYGRQLREYLENMLGDAWVRETIERISREYAGNVPMSRCLFFGYGWEIS
jgi:hypothetical protein